MNRIILNDDDMTLLVDVLEDTEAMDVADVSEAIVNAMEFSGHDRHAAHAIAAYGLRSRDQILELM